MRINCGLLFAGAIGLDLHYTSTTEFCTSCHSMAFEVSISSNPRETT